LKVGQVIPYAAVEAVVKTAKSTCRFKTITGRWRRLVERDSEVILGAEKGVGFRVLDNSEKLELSCSKLRSGVKSTRRSFHVAGYVERKALSVEEAKRYDMMTARAAAVMAAAQMRGRGTELPKLA